MIPCHRPPKLDDATLQAFLSMVEDAVNSGRYTKGNLSQVLSERIAKYHGYEYAIPFGQATHAISILARWYRKQRFRKMIAPAFTWPSTYVPFLWSGFEVRFCDIDRDTWLAEPSMLTDIDEIFCPVDTFGSVWDGLDSTRIWIDSAQSFGSPWKNVEMNRDVSLSSTK